MEPCLFAEHCHEFMESIHALSQQGLRIAIGERMMIVESTVDMLGMREATASISTTSLLTLVAILSCRRVP